jgi:Xaa-Pro dipeptidase
MSRKVCSPEAIQIELATKRERILDLLEHAGLDAILISRHENIAWATAGLVDVRVGLLRETGPASLLITKAGKAYYLATNNEALRLADEEFTGLDYEPIVSPWHENDVEAVVRRSVGSGAVASDAPVGELPLLSLQALRYELTEAEVQRYRSLGRDVAEVVACALLQLRPGQSERLIQADVARRLIERGILPSVYMTAADDRIRKYMHAVPRAGVLRHFGMVGLCARRWGLVVSMTRFVHFGQMPGELEARFAAVNEISARLKVATLPGVSASSLFGIAREAYADLGFAGQEMTHHQGGATGYVEREWFARPEGGETARETQAFAWNPNLEGAKSEDTILLCRGSVEVLTATPDLPVLKNHVDGVEMAAAGVLIRD